MANRTKRTISFHYNEVDLKIKNSKHVKECLMGIMEQEETDFQRVDYIFCNDSFLIGLNKHYLDHDTYTDILTFTLSALEEPIVSEIYISVDRIKENAASFGVSFENELHRVMIHGLLHLCGYEDSTDKQKKQMRQRESYYLNQF